MNPEQRELFIEKLEALVEKLKRERDSRIMNKDNDKIAEKALRVFTSIDGAAKINDKIIVEIWVIKKPKTKSLGWAVRYKDDPRIHERFEI